MVNALPMQGAQVQSLVGELRSRMLHGAAKKKKIPKKPPLKLEEIQMSTVLEVVPGNTVHASDRGSSPSPRPAEGWWHVKGGTHLDAEPLLGGDHVRQSPSWESDRRFLPGKSVAHSLEETLPFQL